MYTERSMSDWNAAEYHRVSDPQHGWGLRVLERLAPRAGERILDIGCGTGRLTSQISERAGGADVTGTDRSLAMLAQAITHYPGAAMYVQADGVDLPFPDRTFDAVFSTATFHWIKDHDRLFREIHRILKPGGRLVSQCGGGPNLQELYVRAQRLRTTPAFAAYFEGWGDPWHFAAPEQTHERLRQAGFSGIRVTLEPAHTPFPDLATYEEFITTVCMRHHTERLPEALRQPFVHELARQATGDNPPLTLDYWRLNADGRK
jgi:trans-aconitate 2-methyltransferase